MKEYLTLLSKTILFEDIDANDIQSMLTCLSAVKRSYISGEYIYHAGDEVKSIALLLSGSVHIQKEDYWGNLSILGEIAPGELFGEVFACLKKAEITQNVIAVKDSSVLFLDINRIATTCAASCQFHSRLIRNLLMVLAEKNRKLNQKIAHISQRSIREKLLSYLNEQSLKQGRADFDIPFNRQQLADYLSVDRSAMCRELASMRDEGIIKYMKNKFYLEKL